MLSAYLTDIVQFSSIATAGPGTKTETWGADIHARIRDENRLVVNSEGQELGASMSIIVPVGTAVNTTGRVRVIKRFGITYEDGRAFKILAVRTHGDFSAVFKEVLA